jgi:C1A family cysteine protease
MTKNYITMVLLLLSLTSMAAAVNDTDIISIDNLQAQIDASGAKWTAGNTSVSEFRFAGAMIKERVDVPVCEAPTNVSYPDEFNWHDMDGVDWMTPVKSQGSCGGCWAFGVTGAVEAMANIDNNNPDLDIDLSEQYLVSDCCSAGNCGGGWPNQALGHIKHTGMPNESCYPYLARNSVCAPCENWSKYSIEDYVKIKADVDSYKWALQNYGAMVVVLTVPDDWYYYRSGVYEPVRDVGWANHCVVLTGWNDSDDCWIIKNSWGARWGEEGYGRVKYGNLVKYNYGYAILNTSTPSEPKLTLSVQDVAGAGDRIRTSIAVSGDVAVSGLISAIQYNSSMLELIGVAANTSIPSANLWTWNGLSHLLFVSAPQTNMDIINLEFEILQTGKTTIRIVPDETYVVGADFDFIDDVAFEDGIVTIHIIGDLTQDGIVDVRDVARCNCIIAGISEPTPYDLLVGDLNKNGRIDQDDMTAIADMVIGG